MCVYACVYTYVCMYICIYPGDIYIYIEIYRDTSHSVFGLSVHEHNENMINGTQ